MSSRGRTANQDGRTADPSRQLSAFITIFALRPFSQATPILPSDGFLHLQHPSPDCYLESEDNDDRDQAAAMAKADSTVKAISQAEDVCRLVEHSRTGRPSPPAPVLLRPTLRDTRQHATCQTTRPLSARASGRPDSKHTDLDQTRLSISQPSQKSNQLARARPQLSQQETRQSWYYNVFYKLDHRGKAHFTIPGYDEEEIYRAIRQEQDASSPVQGRAT